MDRPLITELTDKELILATNEPEFELDKGTVNFYWETWFDVDRYFGTETADDDSAWVNMYSDYDYNTDTLTSYLCLDKDGGDERLDFVFTAEEEAFLRKRIEDTLECSLKDYYEKETKPLEEENER